MSKLLIVFGDRTADEVIGAFRRTALATTFDRVEKWYYQQDGSAAEIERVAAPFAEVYYHVGVVDEYLRVAIVDLASQLGWEPWTVIDPLAYVDPSAEIGPGCFIAAQSVVSCRARLGAHSLVHVQAMVGHDVTAGEHSIFLPGAKVSGGVVLGNRCLVGSNAFVLQNSVLGDRVKIDALGYAKGVLEGGTVVTQRRELSQQN
jgi:carbonic anhydrase/acetyltransferase-like protein (isoleucine patch superfamily)